MGHDESAEFQQLPIRQVMSRIARGQIKLEWIGSISVAKGANPRGVASASMNAIRAEQLAARAKVYFSEGKYAEAFICQLQSLVIEDSIGNLAGISSDLGNLGAMYGKLGFADKAEKCFRRASEIDGELLSNLSARVEMNRIPTERAAANCQEYHCLLGLHLEGLVLALTNQKKYSAAKGAVDQAVVSFRECGQSEGEERALKMQAWLVKKVAAQP